MQASLETTAAAPVAPVYVALPAAPRRGLRAWRGLGLLAGLAGAGGLGAWAFGDSLRSLLRGPGAGSDQLTYTVKPIDLDITLTEDGELKPKHSIEIKCEVEGQSTILFLVAESTRVKPGDLLVELSSDTLVERIEREEVELRKAEADLRAAREDLEIQRSQNASDERSARIALEVAELELRKYLEGDYPQRVKEIEIAIEQDRLELARNQDQLEKNRRLKEKDYVTQSKIDQLELEVRRSEMSTEKNQLALKTLNEYERPKFEMQKRADVESAREELERVRQRAASKETQARTRVEQNESLLKISQTRFARLKDQLAKTKMYAPVEGVIQYPVEGGRWSFGEARVTVGARVNEGETLVILPDTSQMIVSMRVHEADRHFVSEGTQCIVKVPAVPGRTFSGTISKIAKFADSANRWWNPELKEHATEILLDATDAPVQPGDSAEIRILIDTLQDVLAVPVQCVYTRGSRSFVFVPGALDAQVREVKLGRANTSMIEIASGLESGERVAMHADERMVAKLPAPTATREPAAPPVEQAGNAQPASAAAGASASGSSATAQP